MLRVFRISATPPHRVFTALDVEEVLNGSCLRRLEDYIEETGGKYFNPGYAPPPGW